MLFSKNSQQNQTRSLKFIKIEVFMSKIKNHRSCSGKTVYHNGYDTRLMII